MTKQILAIDAGTTGITLHLYNQNLQLIEMCYSEFPQYYPQPGWVEQDGEEIWQTTLKLMREIDLKNVAAIGITNQRETVLVWDKNTSKPLYRAIVWQCRRTAKTCEKMAVHKAEIQKKTGLLLDAYFSATKIKWLKDCVPEVDQAFINKTAAVGTVDTWLLWKLTGGQVHATDYTNASRTMLFNIHQKKWDPELLRLFDVSEEALPEVHSSAYLFGHTKEEIVGRSIPITGIAGDQQSALFGQRCVEKGQFKNTYGTGCFLLLNTGDEPIDSKGLLTTLACDKKGQACYGLEGSIFIAGAAVQWLRDGLKIIETASETEDLARSVDSAEGVHFLPAFVGMGAPYWDMNVRGTLFGLTRGSTRAHIVRATLESIAYQTKGLVNALSKDCSFELKSLRVDGGACANNFLMQFQSDVLQMRVIRPQNIESTALGAASLAGLGANFWEDFSGETSEDVTAFSPKISAEEGEKLYRDWKETVEQVLKISL